ncbi:MAG TPA: dTMP kinase [Acidimicrobiales bacterium]|nr:dTMP kinase [Acidimicrobiales bacterium]
MRGRLIALEGIDGCGKSTQARLLAKWIGDASVLTSEPGATVLGSSLRRLLLDPELPSLSNRAEALVLAADRADHVAEVIAPRLAEGRWVVCDRYSGSTFAYQGYGRGLDLDALRQLVDFATQGTYADLNVLVDVPFEVARARLSGSAADRFEGLDDGFHRRVRDGYMDIAASDDSWVVVDGTGTVDDVSRRVSAAVNARLAPLPGGVN